MRIKGRGDLSKELILRKRINGLEKELAGVDRHLENMQSRLLATPDDDWAAGMVRHYRKRREQLALQLSALTASLNKSVGEG